MIANVFITLRQQQKQTVFCVQVRLCTFNDNMSPSGFTLGEKIRVASLQSSVIIRYSASNYVMQINRNLLL